MKNSEKKIRTLWRAFHLIRQRLFSFDYLTCRIWRGAIVHTPRTGRAFLLPRLTPPNNITQLMNKRNPVFECNIWHSETGLDEQCLKV